MDSPAVNLVYQDVTKRLETRNQVVMPLYEIAYMREFFVHSPLECVSVWIDGSGQMAGSAFFTLF
jgi:hypothetical protein